jgi:hypothetical protein
VPTAPGLNLVSLRVDAFLGGEPQSPKQILKSLKNSSIILNNKPRKCEGKRGKKGKGMDR